MALPRAQPAAGASEHPLRLRVPRRVSGFAGGLMLVIGVVLILDALVTVVWQDPFTAVFTQADQKALSKQLAASEKAPLPGQHPGPGQASQDRPAAHGGAGPAARGPHEGRGAARPDLDRQGRRELRVRGRHGREEPQARARALCEQRAARPARDRRDRGAPDDIRLPVPAPRQVAPRRPDHVDDALRAVHLQRRGHARRVARAIRGCCATCATTGWC